MLAHISLKCAQDVGCLKGELATGVRVCDDGRKGTAGHSSTQAEVQFLCFHMSISNIPVPWEKVGQQEGNVWTYFMGKVGIRIRLSSFTKLANGKMLNWMKHSFIIFFSANSYSFGALFMSVCMRENWSQFPAFSVLRYYLAKPQFQKEKYKQILFHSCLSLTISSLLDREFTYKSRWIW